MDREDYPKNFEEFITRFATENDCLDYIASLRWPDGFICPRCKSSKSWETARGLIHCAECGCQTSIIAGTLFQDTRKPLRLWFHVMWWVMSQKTGASAKNLQHTMGFKRYATAWIWLHKLRRVMIRPGRELLSGNVEVDETYLGSEEEGAKGRKIVRNTLVAIAVEVKVGHLGRVRFRQIPDASGDSLIPFVKDNVEPGSTVITDGWKGYVSLAQHGYHHEVHKIAGSNKTASELLPHVHLVVSLVKRWLMGTHQGAVSSQYLSFYLDEYSFRFNRRLSTHRGKLFYRLMQQAVNTQPIHQKKISSAR